MQFAPRSFTPDRTARAERLAAVRAPFTAHGRIVVVALLLAACARSPYAAVPVAGSDVAQSAVLGAAACRETAAARSALQNISRELQAQGMAMKATCQADGGGWVVQIRVMDGVKANQVVRGPLADGHDVDMGTPLVCPSRGPPRHPRAFRPTCNTTASGCAR